eukprot:SAG31_NODE_1928_length_6883_cov_6.045106_10_plen_92_part_00
MANRRPTQAEGTDPFFSSVCTSALCTGAGRLLVRWAHAGKAQAMRTVALLSDGGSRPAFAGAREAGQYLVGGRAAPGAQALSDGTLSLHRL